MIQYGRKHNVIFPCPERETPESKSSVDFRFIVIDCVSVAFIFCLRFNVSVACLCYSALCVVHEFHNKYINK